MARPVARPRRSASRTAKSRWRPGAPWRFDSFTQDDYRTLYEDLRTSVLKVDAYSDLDTLPETPNVTVNRLP